MAIQNSLFDIPKPNDSDAMYNRVRSSKDPNSVYARECCENLWRDYREHAEKQWIHEFPRRFHERWFEMYLTVSLLRAGIAIDCSKPGPDIFAEINGRRVFIEAVCVGPGDRNKPDSVPHIKPGSVGDVPVREYVLRINSSLSDKAKKFKTYIDEGKVDLNDLAAIALNMGRFPFLSLHIRDVMVRSVYGLGDEYISYDKATGDYVGYGRKSVPELRKKSTKASVNVQSFADGVMPHISAALLSEANAFTQPNTLGSDFWLFPNLTASSLWPPRLIPMSQEFVTIEKTENEWVLNLVHRVEC